MRPVSSRIRDPQPAHHLPACRPAAALGVRAIPRWRPPPTTSHVSRNTDGWAYRLNEIRWPSACATSMTQARRLRGGALHFGWDSRRRRRTTVSALPAARTRIVWRRAEAAVDPASGVLTVLHVVEAFECGAIKPGQRAPQVEGAIIQGWAAFLRKRAIRQRAHPQPRLRRLPRAPPGLAAYRDGPTRPSRPAVGGRRRDADPGHCAGDRQRRLFMPRGCRLRAIRRWRPTEWSPDEMRAMRAWYNTLSSFPLR